MYVKIFQYKNNSGDFGNISFEGVYLEPSIERYEEDIQKYIQYLPIPKRADNKTFLVIGYAVRKRLVFKDRRLVIDEYVEPDEFIIQFTYSDNDAIKLLKAFAKSVKTKASNMFLYIYEFSNETTGIMHEDPASGISQFNNELKTLNTISFDELMRIQLKYADYYVSRFQYKNNKLIRDYNCSGFVCCGSEIIHSDLGAIAWMESHI